MRSQYIKIRNVPSNVKKEAVTIHVKPWWLLFVLMIAGVILMISKAYMFGLSVSMVILSLFALLFLPDRILVQFMSDYMILYNRPEREECTMIYYDEIVSWYYVYHRNVDTLVVEVLDGESQEVDMFSKRSVYRYLKRYAPGKEKKEYRKR